MGDLSRKSSRQPILSDDENSLTSFPDPSSVASSLHQTKTNTNEPLDRLLDVSGPSIFDEQPSAIDPQTLSASPAPVLQNVIDHQGAVHLVRRLAALLAERDAHVTALTRLAEEYKVPKERISAAASRVRQAEERRLALSTAADEDWSPLAALDGGDAMVAPRLVESTTTGGTVKGLTRFFAGNTLKARRGSDKASVTSSRSTSQVRKPTRARPQSMDARSIASNNTVQSTDSGGPGWAANLFGSNVTRPRHDSRTIKEPLELVTQHDKDQLPPTLSNRAEDPQTAAWNRFLTRLMETRTDSGDQANGIGTIGASHFGQEGALGQKKMKTLTQLLLGGIPMSLRHTIWMELSNTDAILEPGTYTSYLDLRDSVDPAEIDAILKDVPRTLTSKYEYYAKKGDKRLKEVLLAFVSKYEGLGYTQGLNTIAGYLLLAIPEDEHAFWMLCNMVDHFFPRGYFSREKAMTGPLADSIVLRQYVRDHLPPLAKHMDELGIAPDHTVPLKWFFTAFSDALPEDVLMRVWDIWLCVPGHKTFLFNVALAILAQNMAGLMECESEGEYWTFLDGRCRVDGEGGEGVNELVRQAVGWRKKLEHVEERRALEVRLLRKKGDSTEALYSPEVELGASTFAVGSV